MLTRNLNYNLSFVEASKVLHLFNRSITISQLTNRTIHEVSKEKGEIIEVSGHPSLGTFDKNGVVIFEVIL